MDAVTNNSVRTLLANLAEASLAGDARGAPPDAACVRRVGNSLSRAREFLAPVLERWSDSERRALFETLNGSVEQFRGGCRVELEIHAPDDETAAAVGARFAHWLTERIEMEQRLSVLRARVIGRKASPGHVFSSADRVISLKAAAYGGDFIGVSAHMADALAMPT